MPDLWGEDPIGWYGKHSGIVNNGEAKYGIFIPPTFTGRGERFGGSTQGDNTCVRGVKVAASNCNAIYGRATVVRPESYSTRWYIKY